MEVLCCLLLLLFPSAIVSQTFDTIPPSDGPQPVDVIGKEGDDVSLYCVVFNPTQALTIWQYKRTNDSKFQNVMFNANNDVIGPGFLLNKIEAEGDLLGSGNLTFRTNFTFLNFTDEFNLITFQCGPPNQDTRRFRLGLPGQYRTTKCNTCYNSHSYSITVAQCTYSSSG